jgi:CheY-like chemotaxis protein
MPGLLKFLVVDDVAENRFIVVKTLLRKFPGSSVQECEESAPALAAAQHDRLSAVVVHRGLDVDGPQMIAQLRRVNPSVPIIMVSGREEYPEAIEAGANVFLNYSSWGKVGTAVEAAIAMEKAEARPSKFPFTAVPPKPAA